jgi:hypothetical protein
MSLYHPQAALSITKLKECPEDSESWPVGGGFDTDTPPLSARWPVVAIHRTRARMGMKQLIQWLASGSKGIEVDLSSETPTLT